MNGYNQQVMPYPNMNFENQRNNTSNIQNNPWIGNNNLLSNNPYNNNYMGQQLNQQNSMNLQNQLLKCRPVSSREEAIAFQIDLDGSLWVFTDIGNGRIYTKQIRNDGTAAFNTYVYTEEAPQLYETNNNNFVTKEEFESVIQSLKAAIGANATVSNNQQPAPAEQNKPINF